MNFAQENEDFMDYGLPPRQPSPSLLTNCNLPRSAYDNQNPVPSIPANSKIKKKDEVEDEYDADDDDVEVIEVEDDGVVVKKEEIKIESDSDEDAIEFIGEHLRTTMTKPSPRRSGKRTPSRRRGKGKGNLSGNEAQAVVSSSQENGTVAPPPPTPSQSRNEQPTTEGVPSVGGRSRSRATSGNVVSSSTPPTNRNSRSSSPEIVDVTPPGADMKAGLSAKKDANRNGNKGTSDDVGDENDRDKERDLEEERQQNGKTNRSKESTADKQPPKAKVTSSTIPGPNHMEPGTGAPGANADVNGTAGVPNMAKISFQIIVNMADGSITATPADPPPMPQQNPQAPHSPKPKPQLVSDFCQTGSSIVNGEHVQRVSAGLTDLLSTYTSFAAPSNSTHTNISNDLGSVSDPPNTAKPNSPENNQNRDPEEGERTSRRSRDCSRSRSHHRHHRDRSRRSRSHSHHRHQQEDCSSRSRHNSQDQDRRHERYVRDNMRRQSTREDSIRLESRPPLFHNPKQLIKLIKRCSHCEKSFDSRREGVDHQKKEHNRKHCPVCFKLLSCKGNAWKDHLMRRHSDNGNEMASCPFCSKLQNFEGMIQHLGKVHLTPIENRSPSPDTDDPPLLIPNVPTAAHNLRSTISPATATTSQAASSRSGPQSSSSTATDCHSNQQQNSSGQSGSRNNVNSQQVIGSSTLTSGPVLDNRRPPPTATITRPRPTAVTNHLNNPDILNIVQSVANEFRNQTQSTNRRSTNPTRPDNPARPSPYKIPRLSDRLSPSVRPSGSTSGQDRTTNSSSSSSSEPVAGASRSTMQQDSDSDSSAPETDISVVNRTALKIHYQQNPTPDGTELSKIAKKLGFSVKKVKDWFAKTYREQCLLNRNAKKRKM